MWITDGRGQRAYTRRPHVGTCQRNPPAKAGLYKYTVKAPELEGKAHWAGSRLGFTISLGLSADGKLKARRKTANGLTPPLQHSTVLSNN